MWPVVIEAGHIQLLGMMMPRDDDGHLEAQMLEEKCLDQCKFECIRKDVGQPISKIPGHPVMKKSCVINSVLID